jgi:RimJ/RimL family protein N-acetyltransferase
MDLNKYGVTLRSLEKEDIEMVRNWRNGAHVRPYMEYQEYITPEMQSRWFQAIDKTRNLYFIIKHKEKKIGLIHLKNIDLDVKSAEAGIFIGDTAYLNSLLPVAATVALMEFAFETLQLGSLKAKMSRENAKVILFNQSLGYRKAVPHDEAAFEYYTVTRENFYLSTEGMRQTLAKLSAARG